MKHQLSERINLLNRLNEKPKNNVEGYLMLKGLSIIDNSREYKRENVIEREE